MSTEIGRKPIVEAEKKDGEGFVCLNSFPYEDGQLINGFLRQSALK